jgi:putative aminopeptidase FrvX
LLGEKKIGNGEGATILLSAHMDTVRGVLYDRVLIENNGVYTSSKGALGGDDRAGIAIVMEVLRNIDSLSFEGIIKVAFSREEEIGCIGSGKIDPKWYEDVDLAIVVDRKGNRDIVTGCYGAFCSNAVGVFFEEVSKMQGMDWKAVEGGVSDAMTFAYEGINSVNLSAGYMHEHTDKEYLIFEDMRDTVRLILQAFGVVNNFYATFGEVPADNKWSTSYTKTAKKASKYEDSYKSYGYGSYYEDSFVEDIYAEEADKNGDVYIYEVGHEIVIQQGEDEIILSHASLKSLLGQIKVAL